MADFTKGSSSSSGSTEHSHSDSDSMSMSMPAMVFHTSIYDPLYSSSWTPATLGEYVGTIIFLILLGFTYRFLMAWKSNLEHYWRSGGPVVVIAGKEVKSEDGEQKQEEERKPKGPEWDARAWRWSVDLPRALMTTGTSGVGYLLYVFTHLFPCPRVGCHDVWHDGRLASYEHVNANYG